MCEWGNKVLEKRSVYEFKTYLKDKINENQKRINSHQRPKREVKKNKTVPPPSGKSRTAIVFVGLARESNKVREKKKMTTDEPIRQCSTFRIIGIVGQRKRQIIINKEEEKKRRKDAKNQN